jgi:hypothetical protein
MRKRGIGVLPEVQQITGLVRNSTHYAFASKETNAYLNARLSHEFAAFEGRMSTEDWRANLNRPAGPRVCQTLS